MAYLLSKLSVRLVSETLEEIDLFPGLGLAELTISGRKNLSLYRRMLRIAICQISLTQQRSTSKGMSHGNPGNHFKKSDSCD